MTTTTAVSKSVRQPPPAVRGRPLDILQKEIEILSKKNIASYSAAAKAQFVAFFALASLGAIYSLWLIFAAPAFNAWAYLASISALGVGGIVNKQLYTGRVQRQSQIAELKECQNALQVGRWTPFKRHLDGATRKTFNVPELLQIYRSFKESQKALA